MSLTHCDYSRFIVERFDKEAVSFPGLWRTYNQIKEAASASQMRFNIRQASEKDLASIMERAYAGF